MRKFSAASRIAAIILCAYFLYFAAGAVRAHFAADDVVNLGRYYERGFARVLYDTIAFWTDAYRPTGGLFYLLIYSGFGLNALAYRIVVLALIAANIYLTWRIALRVTSSEAAAWLAAMLACAHASQLPIYYYTSFVYDVLAYFFTALMLTLHIERRSQFAVILAYFAAINSKEIAIVGVVWVIAYEFFVAKPQRWLAPAVMAALAIAFAAGKMFGAGAVGQLSGYETQFTLHRFAVNNCRYLNDLFYSSFFHPGVRLEIAWILLTLAVAFMRRRELRCGWALVSTAMLPVAFTVVPRDRASLYLPLLAWSLFLATWLARILQRPMHQWMAATALAAVVAFHTIQVWSGERQQFLDAQSKTWSVITQLHDLHARPAPNARVIFLANPFDDWDVYFIARLLWHDRSIDIQLAGKMATVPTPTELDKFDWILTFENADLRVLRRP